MIKQIFINFYTKMCNTNMMRLGRSLRWKIVTFCREIAIVLLMYYRCSKNPLRQKNSGRRESFRSSIEIRGRRWVHRLTVKSSRFRLTVKNYVSASLSSRNFTIAINRQIICARLYRSMYLFLFFHRATKYPHIFLVRCISRIKVLLVSQRDKTFLFIIDSTRVFLWFF